MTKAENANVGATKGPGCCGGHNHSGDGRHDHHARKPNSAAPEGTIYTCPMHPQIRQVGPGNCPICGMALEPEVASLDAPPNPELAGMTRRFWIGLVLSLPAVVLEMGAHLAGGHGWIDQTLSNWIQLVFATPVVLWAGWPFFVRGWQSLVTRNLNMFTLIAMGTGVAYVYSLIGTVVPDIFPATFRGHDGAVAVYFEAAAVITVLVLLVQVLELRARGRWERDANQAAAQQQTVRPLPPFDGRHIDVVIAVRAIVGAKDRIRAASCVETLLNVRRGDGPAVARQVA